MIKKKIMCNSCLYICSKCCNLVNVKKNYYGGPTTKRHTLCVCVLMWIKIPYNEMYLYKYLVIEYNSFIINLKTL